MSPSSAPAAVAGLHARCDAAAAAWTVLSTAYGRVPDAGFVAALRSPEQLGGWPYDDRESRSGLDLLLASGRGVSTEVAAPAGGAAAAVDAAEDLPALVADHRRLFVGPRPLLAAPWESVHRSREGLVFEAQTIEVRLAYREFGLESPLLNREPDDHIALEAAFVAQLCVRAMEALEHDRPEESTPLIDGVARFHREHLSAWVPALLERVEEHARTDFYRGIGRLTGGALEQLGVLG